MIWNTELIKFMNYRAVQRLSIFCFQVMLWLKYCVYLFWQVQILTQVH